MKLNANIDVNEPIGVAINHLQPTNFSFFFKDKHKGNMY